VFNIFLGFYFYSHNYAHSEVFLKRGSKKDWGSKKDCCFCFCCCCCCCCLIRHLPSCDLENLFNFLTTRFYCWFIFTYIYIYIYIYIYKYIYIYIWFRSDSVNICNVLCFCSCIYWWPFHFNLLFNSMPSFSHAFEFFIWSLVCFFVEFLLC